MFVCREKMHPLIAQHSCTKNQVHFNSLYYPLSPYPPHLSWQPSTSFSITHIHTNNTLRISRKHRHTASRAHAHTHIVASFAASAFRFGATTTTCGGLLHNAAFRASKLCTSTALRSSLSAPKRRRQRPAHRFGSVALTHSLAPQRAVEQHARTVFA